MSSPDTKTNAPPPPAKPQPADTRITGPGPRSAAPDPEAASPPDGKPSATRIVAVAPQAVGPRPDRMLPAPTHRDPILADRMAAEKAIRAQPASATVKHDPVLPERVAAEKKRFGR
jgi:hypothetical protein